MPMLAIVFGAALTVLGLLGYFTTGMISWTALIPAFFGVPLLLLGALALKPTLRKHAMHAAAALGLFGLLGSAMGVPKLITLLTGGTVARPGAAITQAIMAVLCLIFLALCVKSFIDARRNRAADTIATRTGDR